VKQIPNRLGLMVRLSVSDNTADLIKGLDSLQRKQLPFALSRSINSIGIGISQNESEETKKVFHNPIPFTVGKPNKAGAINAFPVRFGNKKSPAATVSIHPLRAKYLHFEITGATFTKANNAGHAVRVPTSKIKLNKYGNLAKGAQKRLLAKKYTKGGTRHNTTFAGVPKGGRFAGQAGIWRRYGTGHLRDRSEDGRNMDGRIGLTRLVSWVGGSTHRPIFNFYGVAAKIINASFDRVVQAELRNALWTANMQAQKSSGTRLRWRNGGLYSG